MPTFDKWYRKTHKKVYPITITGRPDEDEAIQAETEKVSEESQVHDPVSHPFKYPTDRVSNINKTLQQKVNDLLSQISVGNKVRFGSTSQKGTKKKAVPVQDREKDKEGEYSTSTI